MKLIIRNTNNTDIDKLYNLHKLCFSHNDLWYKNHFKNYLLNGIVVENSENNEILGLLLQGLITPCNKNINIFNNDNLIDKFDPINEIGTLFLNNNIHYKEHFGILMICVHPNFRNKGIASKLIDKHINFSHDNNYKVICLNTRKSNINAQKLYKKKGYQHIADIQNKYFLPNENSVFMIKLLNY